MSPKKKFRIQSKIHKKILSFFLENQGSIDTQRGISTWTNENVKKITQALEQLAGDGSLKADRPSSTVGYSGRLNKKELRNLSE